MKHKWLLLYSWFIRIFLFILPDIPLIMRFRGRLYGLFMNKSGHDFQVSASTILRGIQNISVGDNVYFAPGVFINARGKVDIESEVQVGINSVIVSSTHLLKNGSYRLHHTSESIYIGYGSWIAANCTMVAGSSLPQSSVLAANSVITKKFSEAGVYGGVPAKLITKNSL